MGIFLFGETIGPERKAINLHYKFTFYVFGILLLWLNALHKRKHSCLCHIYKTIAQYERCQLCILHMRRQKLYFRTLFWVLNLKHTVNVSLGLNTNRETTSATFERILEKQKLCKLDMHVNCVRISTNLIISWELHVHYFAVWTWVLSVCGMEFGNASYLN